MKQRGSSLLSLQSLEKDFDGLDEQLVQLRDIVQIDVALQVYNDYDQETIPCRYHGREEWAIKLLLRRLQSAELQGSEARLSHRAWTTLAHLIRVAPAHITVKAFAANKFLDSLENALVEFVRASDRAVIPSDSASKGVDLEKSTPAQRHETETRTENASSSARKRKRNESVVPEARSTKQKTAPEVSEMSGMTKTQEIDYVEVFEAIGLLLHSIANMQSHHQPSKPDTPIINRDLFLSSDSDHSARILGAWLSALDSMKTHFLSNSESSNRMRDSLGVILRIWECSSSSLTSAAVPLSISFSKHCLIPSAILLSGDGLRIPQPDGSSFLLSSVIERLVAQNLFMEAKAAFFAKSQQQDTNMKSLVSGSPTDLTALLQPLYGCIRENLSSNSETELMSAVSLLRSIPALFSIAIRCTPLTTPRRRLAEYPWLEEVFLRLSSCLGFSIDSQTHTMTKEEERLQMTKMLEVAHQNKLRLDPAILKKIAVDCGGLSSNNIWSPNWTAIGHLIALDANIFLKENRSPKSKFYDDNRHNLNDLLFSIMTERVWFTDEDSNATSQISRRSEYEEVKSKVLIPLLHAYSNGRDISGFLSHWHLGLVQFSKDSTRDRNWSIWEDPHLQLEFGEIFETAMTLNRISSFIDETSLDLEWDRKTEISVSKHHQASASAQLLAVLFDGIRSNETKTAVLARLFKVLEDTLSLLGSEKFKGTRHRSRCWRLVASSHHLWASVIPSENLVTISPHEVLDKQFLRTFRSLSSVGSSHSLEETDENVHERSEALACIGSILNDVQDRQWDQRPLKRLSVSLLESLAQDSRETSAAAKVRLWRIVAQFPILLQPSPELGIQLREECFYQITKCDEHLAEIDHLSDIFRSTESPSSELISHSLRGSTWLIKDIINTIPNLAIKQDKQDLSNVGFEPLREMKELSYMKIPSVNFQRSERKKILVECAETLKNMTNTFRASDWSRTLSLMLHLMSVTTGGAGLGIPFADVLMIADIMDISFQKSDGKRERDSLEIFTKIVEQSLRHDMHVAGQQQVEANSVLAARRAIETTPAKSLATCRLVVLSMILELLSMPTKNQAQISTANNNIQTELCLSLCESVSQAWTGFKSSTAEAGSIACLLEPQVEVLAKIDQQILRKHQFAAHGVITVVERALQELKDNSPQLAQHTGRLAVLNYMLGWRSDAGDPEALDLSAAYKILQEGSKPEAQVLLRDFLLDAFMQLSEQQRGDKLRDLLNECRTSSPTECSSRWHLLHMLVSAGNKSKSTAYKDLVPASEAAIVLTTLASNLAQSPNIRTFHYIATSMVALLRNNAKAATQPAIESVLLGTITAISPTSPIKISVHPTHGPRMFTMLTTIIRILLSQHRRRLRGRFELLVAALQALLAQLFVQPRGTSRSFAWPLTATHADAFTRLVTSLCDPSVSATTAGRHRNLTDETRKARNYAGQYVPSLLLTLCDLQLRGRFAADGVREALAQGVYAMLDAMGKDVLGATNEGIGMPAGVRTVLRQWWEAWRRERN